MLSVDKGIPTHRFVKAPLLLFYFGITILKDVDWVEFHVVITSTINKACAILKKIMIRFLTKIRFINEDLI